MRERPILFSGPMVRAILEGRKTVTRRPVNPQPAHGERIEWLTNIVSRSPSFAVTKPMSSDVREIECPLGAPGDRLWVRETWFQCSDGAVIYRADDLPKIDADGPWRSSTQMLRAASRLTLDVVSVRVERLHDITDDEIAREGVDREAAIALCPKSWRGTIEGLRPRGLWCAGWDRINGKRAPWSANPWVWRVEFRRCP